MTEQKSIAQSMLDEYKADVARALKAIRLLAKYEAPGARDAYVLEAQAENPELSEEEAAARFADALVAARSNRGDLVLEGPAYTAAMNETLAAGDDL